MNKYFFLLVLMTATINVPTHASFLDFFFGVTNTGRDKLFLYVQKNSFYMLSVLLSKKNNTITNNDIVQAFQLIAELKKEVTIHQSVFHALLESPQVKGMDSKTKGILQYYLAIYVSKRKDCYYHREKTHLFIEMYLALQNWKE